MSDKLTKPQQRALGILAEQMGTIPSARFAGIMWPDRRRARCPTGAASNLFRALADKGLASIWYSEWGSEARVTGKGLALIGSGPCPGEGGA